MKLSPAQLQKFWDKSDGWPAAVRDQGWTKEEGERQRKLMLAKCGFRSLTEVDRTKGFDRVLQEVAVLRCDLTALRSAEDSPRRVLLRAIEEYSAPLSSAILPSAIHPASAAPFGCLYLGSIMLDRWGHADLDRLDLVELEQLRDTLAARCSAKGLKRQRQARPSAPGDLPALNVELKPAEVAVDADGGGDPF